MALLYDSSRFNDESEEFFAPEPVGALPSANNAQTLTSLYQDVFSRAPDQGGFDFWLNAMDTMGYTPEMVRSEFLKSPEYLAMQAPAPTPAPTPAPIAAPVGALPTVLTAAQAPAPALAPAPIAIPAPTPSPAPIAEPQIPVEQTYEPKPIIDAGPVPIGFGLRRTPGGTIINEQGYPVSEDEAARIMGTAAPAPSPAPAVGALTQTTEGTTQSPIQQALATGGLDVTPSSENVNPSVVLSDGTEVINNNNQGYMVIKPGQSLQTGTTIELYNPDGTLSGTRKQVQQGNLLTDELFDASGKSLGRKTMPVGQLGQEFAGTALSMLGPYGMALNAAMQASKGNYLGALASVAGAGAGFAGDFGGSLGGISQGTFQNIAAGANTANALKSGNWAGALSSIAGSGVGADALGTQIGDTGFTLGDAFKGSSALMAIQKGQFGQALTSLGQLANSQDTVIAGRALGLMQAVQSGNVNAIANAAQQFGSAMADPGRTSRLPSTTPGTTTTTGPALNATGLSNIENLGISTYVNAINQLGASAEDALAAANAAMNSATSRLDTQNAIENASNFNDAFAKARAAYGSGKTFTWQGQEYSTSTRAEDPALAAASDAARQAAVGAGGGRGTAAGTTVADAVALGGIPLRTTPTTTTTGNKVFEGVQYDALGNVIGGTAYNTEGVDTTTGLGKVGDVAANIVNTAGKMVGTYGPSAVQAGANLLSNVGGAVDLIAGKSTGMGNYLRDSATKISNFVDTISDPDVKAGQQRIGDAIDSADGFGNKVIALGRSMAQNPVSAFNWMLTEAFEEVPGVGLALKSADKLGKWGIYGISMVNDMIESGGGAYNETYANAIQQGMSEADARAAARNSALASMLATGVTQGVVEGKLLTKVAGKETVGEGVEGAAQSAASQLALTGTIDPNKVIKDALIEAAVGRGASSTASGITATNIGGTGATTGALTDTAAGATAGTTAATTGTGGTSTLTGTPGVSTTITGTNLTGIDTSGLDVSTISSINSLPSAITSTISSGGDVSATINSSIGNIITSVASSGGNVAAATNTAVSSAINGATKAGVDTTTAVTSAVNGAITSSLNSGVNASTAITSTVNSAITSAASSGANTTTALTSAVNGAVTTALNSGTDATTAVTSAVNGAVTSAVNSGVNANTAVTSAVNSAVTSAVNAGTDANTAVTSAVNSAVNSAINSGVDTNTAVNSAVTSAVTAAVNAGVDTNAAVTTAVNSAISTAVNTATNTGTDVNTAVTSAVNSAVNSAVSVAVNSGVDTNTAVSTAVNSAVTAAVNAGVDTNTVISSAVTAAVNAGVDANVAVQTAIDAAVNAGVDANIATNIATKVDIPEVKPEQPSEPATSTLPEIPAVQTVPGVDVTPSTVPAVSAPSPAPAVTKPAATAKPSLPTQTGGGFALPAMTAGAALPSLAPQMLKSFETQGYVDPLAAVKQAQAEFGRDQTMQNIDPRLLAILQERQQTGSLGQFAPQESANTPHYTYGTEDSIEDILGGQASGFAKGGYVAPLMATGGMTLPLMAKEGGLPSHKSGREDFKDGKHVAGEGDGQSDDIPAWLADGEFVFPADVVSALGNGSTKAGTDKLYEMMHAIRDRARSKGPKDLPPPAFKSPLDYLKSKK